MREIVQRDASVENVTSTHELILVAHSARPVDPDGVTEDFVRLSDQRKDDFGVWTVD